MEPKQENNTKEEAANSFFEELNSGLGLPKKEGINDNSEDQEEEEEKQEEKQEEKPNFTPEPKKKKATKEESIQALRAQRDELSSKLKSIEESIGSSFDVITPLVSFIQERSNGPITQDVVSSILEDYNNSNVKLTELQSKLQEKESKIKDFDIRQSEEFKTTYQQPYEDAWQGLYYEFANLNPSDNSTIGQKSTESLMNALTSQESSQLQAKDVAILLRKFSADYKSETGEEPTNLPSVTSLLKAQREFIGKRNQIQKAYTNWHQEKEEAKNRAMADQEQQTQLLQAKAKRERVQFATKAFREFDRDEVDFIDDKTLSSFFDEEFSFSEEIIAGGKDIPTHDVLYQRGVKSRLFDHILPKYKELLELEDKVNSGKRTEIKGGGGSPNIKENNPAVSEFNKLLGINK